MSMIEEIQRAVCNEQGTDYSPPPQASRVGIALHTLEQIPLNGMRVGPVGDTSGWYLWGGGEPSMADDFFAPMCVEHIGTRCPAAAAFLALPPGWRFLTDGDYVDVWYDPELLIVK